MNFLRSILFILLILSATLGGLMITTASTPIQIISPESNQVFHYGQSLIIEAKYFPNKVASIGILNPKGIFTPIGVFQFNSSGYLVIDLGTFGSGNLTIPGNYTLSVEIAGGVAASSVTVNYVPYLATIITEVQNSQHIPLAGATVYVYNVTTPSTNKLLATEYTNDTGMVTIHVIAYSFTQYFKIIVSFPGYVNTSHIISITQNQTESVMFTLYPAVLTINVVGANQNGMMIDPMNPEGYTSLTGVEGTSMTVYIDTLFANMETDNATVSISVITPNNVTRYQVKQTTNGYYEATFPLPLLNVSYDALMNITATYGSLSANILIPISAQLNVTEIEQNLIKEITNLNATSSKLSSELKNVSSEITNISSYTQSLSQKLVQITNETSQLSTNIQRLETTTDQLSQDITIFDQQLTTLNHKLNSLTPLIYGALVVAIIGVILAILSLISIRRLIS